ncbi:AMP-binding domain-containing protein [Rhizoctonia solani AG-1 IA]|uniref:AMP-binding domain-containing protein n=1 Tax=Thanatephorus cucumeris (strain AG1-IA) TaxID=983506 RepID=L8WE56_THACA|nr:AMP-binding domain-containing protein [Rhizoctonia solani AG-1 IA]
MRAGLVVGSTISYIPTNTRLGHCPSSEIHSNVTSSCWGLPEVDPPVQFIDPPSLDQVLPDLGKAEREPEYKPFPPLKAISGDTIISILHSSGSTGMPKPVKFHLEAIGRAYAQEGVRSGTMLSFRVVTSHKLVGHVSSNFHTTLRGVHPSVVCSEPCSRSPDIEFNNQSGRRHKMLTYSMYTSIPGDETAIAYLRQMKSIVSIFKIGLQIVVTQVTQIFAGGPLAEATGNKLAEQGVHFRSCYGATEFGGVTETSEVDETSDWNYLQFSPQVDARFIPQNNGDNLFELAFVVSDNHKPFELNFEIDGRPAYRTKDLVVRHPYRPDLWKL